MPKTIEYDEENTHKTLAIKQDAEEDSEVEFKYLSPFLNLKQEFCQKLTITNLLFMRNRNFWSLKNDKIANFAHLKNAQFF